jgi:peptidoglycan/LPS O-acetylase OafA/YrhL
MNWQLGARTGVVVGPSGVVLLEHPGARAARATVAIVQPTYFFALESLRGIAALIVVCFHARWTNPITTLEFVQNGPLMVDFFFVLSGFVIYHSYGDRLKSGSDVARFTWLRLGRLYPLHLACLLVFLAFEIGKWPLDQPAFITNNKFALVSNLLLIHALGVQKKLTFNYPSWSVSAEFYTYLLFALLRLLLPSRRSFVLVAIGVVAISAATLLAVGKFRLMDAAQDWGLIRCTGEFFLGILTYHAYSALRTRLPAWVASGLLSKTLPLVALIATIAFLSQPLFGTWSFAFPLFGAALILTVVLTSGSPIVDLLQARPFRWLGKVSYSIYMVHAAIGWLIAQALSAAFHFPRVLVDGDPALAMSPGGGLLILAVYICAVLLVSQATFRWIEEPFRAKAKEFATQRLAGLISAASSVRLPSRWSNVLHPAPRHVGAWPSQLERRGMTRRRNDWVARRP